MISRAALLILIAGLLGTTGGIAQVLDQARFERDGDVTELTISYLAKLQYVSHTPESGGDFLQIRYLPGIARGLSDQERRESLAWRGPNNVGLVSIRMEQQPPDGLVLLLEFERPQRYAVIPSQDFRSILIRFDTGIDQTQAPERLSGGPPYTIDLASGAEPMDPAAAMDRLPLDGLRLYRRRSFQQGQLTHLLRVGFFEDRTAAEEFLSTAREHFPGARIDSALDTEIEGSRQTALVDNYMPPKRPGRPALPPLTEEKVAALMEQARQSMVDGNLDHAIRLYTKLVDAPPHSASQQALEYLGMARERNGQLAHAKSLYEQYLARYGDAPEATAVRQRLLALTASYDRPYTARLADAAGTPVARSEWDFFGGLSQYARRYTLDDDRTDGTIVLQSAVMSDLDFSIRRRSDTSDLRFRATVGHLLDLESGGDNQTRISSLYLEAGGVERDWVARVGRQSRNSGGVLGRFDGAWLGYQLVPDVRLNLVAGFPVDRTRDGFDSTREVLAASLELTGLLPSWEFLPFVALQTIDGMDDRSAVGLETRYFDGPRSLLGLVDYDFDYQSLNNFLLLGSWSFGDGWKANLNLDYRNSPVLTTRNALQGQGLFTFGELLDRYPESTIRQLAEDRTPRSRSATLGISRQINDQHQLVSDLTVSELNGTPASGDVQAMPGTGTEIYYSLQWIASSLFREGDINVFGLRFNDTAHSDTVTLTGNAWFPLRNKWRLNPRLRFDYRQYDRNSETQLTAYPSMRVQYLLNRRARLELEFGGEYRSRDRPNIDEKSRSYFLSLGYRTDF